MDDVWATFMIVITVAVYATAFANVQFYRLILRHQVRKLRKMRSKDRALINEVKDNILRKWGKPNG